MWYSHHGYGVGWGGWIVGGLMMLAFWGVIVMLAVMLFRSLVGPRREEHTSTSPDVPAALPAKGALDILKERYARGEITKQEYEQMREDILK